MTISVINMVYFLLYCICFNVTCKIYKVYSNVYKFTVTYFMFLVPLSKYFSLDMCSLINAYIVLLLYVIGNNSCYCGHLTFQVTLSLFQGCS